MFGPEATLTRKLFYLYGIVLFSTCLVLFSLRLALTHSIPNFSNFGGAALQSVAQVGQRVGGTLGDVVHAVGRMPQDALQAANPVNLIRPADTAQVPTIAKHAFAVAAVTPPAAAKSFPTSPPAANVTAAATALPPARPPAIAANTYAWGNCTWWVASRRIQIGQPIPSTWGNAATWAGRAARDGYAVDHHPTPGSIMQTSYAARGLGHVAFVESVDPDGTWHISEMNVVGLDVVDHRAEPASAALSYNFIH